MFARGLDRGWYLKYTVDGRKEWREGGSKGEQMEGEKGEWEGGVEMEWSVVKEGRGEEGNYMFLCV